jgi:hypothetical protein
LNAEPVLVTSGWLRMLERTGSLAAERADAAPAQRIVRENGYEPAWQA